MSFDTEELKELDSAKEVHIETHDGGRAYRTVIWVVVDGEEVFVRSVRGEAGKWYQRALADPNVAVLARDLRVPAVAVPAPDPDSVERVNRALRDKYRPGGSLDAMLRSEVLGTTMRLDPA
jgi:hypothetical protein